MGTVAVNFGIKNKIAIKNGNTVIEIHLLLCFSMAIFFMSVFFQHCQRFFSVSLVFSFNSPHLKVPNHNHVQSVSLGCCFSK